MRRGRNWHKADDRAGRGTDWNTTPSLATKRLPHTAKEGGIYDNSYSRDYHNSDEKILVVIQVYLSGNIVPHDGLLFYRCCGSTIE
jgi:hypothetical protein